MKNSILKGVGFGLTSGVITTLGMLVGLNSAEGSRAVMISGILIIAIADSLSDALGVHISEETDGKSEKQIWISTIATFVAKFLISSSFIVPAAFCSTSNAVLISVLWGIILISFFSVYLARRSNSNVFHVVLEHLVIAILVIFLSYWAGSWISSLNLS